MKKFVKHSEYILSDEWKVISNKRKEMDNFSCYWCGSQKGLVCHHKTYKRLGNERIDDLITLCGKCHELVHKDTIENSSHSRIQADLQKVEEYIYEYINSSEKPYKVIDSCLIWNVRSIYIDDICTEIKKQFFRNFLECKNDEELKEAIRIEFSKYTVLAHRIRYSRIIKLWKNGAIISDIASLTGYNEKSIMKHLDRYRSGEVPHFFVEDVQVDLSKLFIPLPV